MKLVKRGLFGSKNIAPTSIYKPARTINKTDYSVLINEFSTDSLIKQLLYKYVTNFSYNISVKVLRNQLDILKPLSLDLKIKILNKTLEKGWKSLIPAYEVFTKNKFDNIKNQYISKDKLQEEIDIMDESF